MTLAKSGCLSRALSSNVIALGTLLSTHSSFADFIITLAVPALARAFSSSSLALSYSPFSLSNFTAANQISSLLGFAWKARARMDRAAGTSPYTTSTHTHTHTHTRDTRMDTHTHGYREESILNRSELTASHLDLAPMSQRTSALGQWATAFCSKVSRLSLVP